MKSLLRVAMAQAQGPCCCAGAPLVLLAGCRDSCGMVGTGAWSKLTALLYMCMCSLQAAKTARGMRRGSLALSQGSSEGTSDSEQGRIMRSAGQFSFAEPDTGSVGKARVSRIGSLAFSQVSCGSCA